MQIPQGSGAAAVKVAGHFFNWVGLWDGKKMNAPEGLDLDCRCVRGLVGNCLFLYILFFVYKIFIPIVTGQVGNTCRSVRRQRQKNGVSHFFACGWQCDVSVSGGERESKNISG